MKAAELQAANDVVCNTYQQAFEEIGLKDHATEDQIKAQLEDVRWRLQKLARERMTLADHKQAEEQLKTVTTDTLRTEYEKGSSDPEKMHKTLVELPTVAKLIFKQQDILADKRFYTQIKHQMKRGKLSPGVAEATQNWHVSQPELGFHDIELFRGAPVTIEFINKETKRRETIPYVKSLQWQRESSYKLEVAKDSARNKTAKARLLARKTADDALAVLAQEIGDLPAADLYAEGLRRKSKHSNGN